MVQNPGSSVFSIAIGRIPLNLVFAEPTLGQKAAARYASFQTSGDGFPVFVYSSEPLRAGAPGLAFSLNGATLRLTESAAYAAGVTNEYLLDSLLRVLLSQKLLDASGFLLHACTVVRDGRAYVFTGRSGAGKSTIARHAPQGAALTDEISLIRRLGSVWHAFGTPFWGEFQAGSVNEHYPLAGIYALVQARENRLEALAPKDAVRALLPNVLFFSRQPAERAALLQVVADLASSLPVATLRFTREITFWEELAA